MHHLPPLLALPSPRQRVHYSPTRTAPLPLRFPPSARPPFPAIPYRSRSPLWGTPAHPVRCAHTSLRPTLPRPRLPCHPQFSRDKHSLGTPARPHMFCI
ncbi:unnamed protein product [Chondrus crispus]|uniref:Uncharacterized protein n=1 Tax=Chondrus crispus TaxID=2769 RepID=R7QUQ8_CHOCR|nr:unnamed protein product [Chondrus crispus]CDF41070.1 unnamed protein product [Chondrus crispus]|eukprot:XP_005711364.1 unnamed protein product [Chondrus crispus]